MAAARASAAASGGLYRPGCTRASNDAINGASRPGPHTPHGSPPNNSTRAGANSTGRNPRTALNSCARHQRQPSPSGTHAADNSARLNSARHVSGITVNFESNERGSPASDDERKPARTLAATDTGVSPDLASLAIFSACCSW
jgi:hypothetical protein